MLSRTADSLYWVSRYVERAEYLARILDATTRLTNLTSAYGGAGTEWQSAVATAGCEDTFAQGLWRGERAQCLRLPQLQPGQSVLDPQLLRPRPLQTPAPCAPR